MADRAILIRKIATFLVLTFAFSGVFYWLIISAGSLKANGGHYVHGLMWCPGAAALLTQLIYQHNIRGLGWRWGGMNYMVVCYSIPLLYALVAYGIVWTTGAAHTKWDYLRCSRQRPKSGNATPTIWHH